jgi:TonB family protein
VRNVFLVFLVFGLIIPLLPKIERADMPKPELSDRVVKLLIEKKLPPPPPPPPKEEPKPEPEKPKPVEVKPKPQDDARKQANKALSVFDQLDKLRDTSLIDKAQQTKNQIAAVNEQTRSDRSILTRNVGVGSGGIKTDTMSRSYGGGAGSLTGRDTTQVASNLGGGDGRSEVRRTSGSGKGARSREEVELTFDQYKRDIYSIYTRALRDIPDLKGKVVMEITIAPTGEVLNCVVVSSELNNPELERKLVLKVKTFRFPARDVESLTLTKPIDFFPAG